MYHVDLYLTEDEQKKLKTQAAQAGLTIRAMVTQFVKEAINKNKKQEVTE